MPSPLFASDLQQFGPEATSQKKAELTEAQAYCKQLTLTHYENFTVGSWLLPKELRQPFCAVYAYCRWADDLADETGGGERTCELLDWWQRELDACFAGETRHPVFVALEPVVRQFEIPQQPFDDLLRAFRQDQTITRYESFDDLLAYCRCSANPVGRLILYLGRCFDEQRAAWSDQICTGLQLANFWQDVADDWQRGRVYLPQESCRRFGYDETMFAQAAHNGAFQNLLAFEVQRAETFLHNGLPLLATLPRRLRFDVSLFAQGGLAILEKIRRIEYDVWHRRPQLTRWDKFRLACRAWLRPA